MVFFMQDHLYLHTIDKTLLQTQATSWSDSNPSYFVVQSIFGTLHMMYCRVYNKKQTKTKATSASKPPSILKRTKETCGSKQDF